MIDPFGEVEGTAGHGPFGPFVARSLPETDRCADA
jgi:hypothetical protein